MQARQPFDVAVKNKVYIFKDYIKNFWKTCRKYVLLWTSSLARGLGMLLRINLLALFLYFAQVNPGTQHRTSPCLPQTFLEAHAENLHTDSSDRGK